MKAVATAAAILITATFSRAEIKIDRTLGLNTKFNYELYGNAGRGKSPMELISEDKKTRTQVYISKAGEILIRNGSYYAIAVQFEKRIKDIYVYKYAVQYDKQMRPIVEGDPYTLTDVIPVDQPINMTVKMASELFNGKVYGDQAVKNFRENYCIFTKRAFETAQRQWEKEENEEGRED
ncbi:MAG: hypothetical protein L7U83_06980 [Akkermansiaceae bacterium]|nr:hypothetical protein [Akkermansiaceae bacterium]